MDRLTEMEAFVSVVDRGGFTGAALHMGVSKSAISKYIAALEDRVGVRLLARTTRRVQPTDVGLAYYASALRALNAVQDADMLALGAKAPPKGRVNILMPADFGQMCFLPSVETLLGNHPALTLHVDFYDPDRGSDPGPKDHDLIVTIAAGVLASGGDGAAASRLLGSVVPHLVAAPAYLHSAGTPRRFEEILGHRLLHMASRVDDNLWHFMDVSGKIRILRGTGRLTVSGPAGLLAACLAGEGIAFLPDYLTAPACAAGQLQKVVPELTGQRLMVHATTPTATAIVPPRVRVLMDHISALLAAL